MLEQNWISFDGTQLYAVLWQPVATPKAVIAFVHGHGTHSRRYDEWIQDYLEAGFAFISYDLRGHGRSAGKQGTIVRYNEYLEDAKLLMLKTRSQFENIPVVLYGHSMGATIVLSLLQQKENLPNLAILTSAWLELVQPPGRLKSLGIWLADSLIPHVTIPTGLKAKDFAPAVTNEPPKPKDPLMHKRMSARTFREVERAIARIDPEELPKNFPMLFMHGTHDRVSAPAASKQLANSFPRNFTYREWEGGPHQLHAWDQSKQVTKYTIDWINKHL